MNPIAPCHVSRREGPVLCLSLSAAWQRTHVIPGFTPGRVNRARQTIHCQGGKTCNSARVLRSLGREVVLVGFNGGATGEQLAAYLRALRITCALIEIPEPTRICTTVLDPEAGTSTELVEEAPWPAEVSVRALMDEIRRLAPTASAALLAGALPPGAPVSFYTDVTRLLHEHGVPVFIDTNGEAYRRVRREQPLFMKLNRSEQRATGPESIDDFARETADAGVPWLLVTDGRHPARLYGPEGLTEFTPAQVNEVNPIGCGDATTAGIIDAWLDGHPMPRAIQFGMACGAANAQTLTAGDIDKTHIHI